MPVRIVFTIAITVTVAVLIGGSLLEAITGPILDPRVQTTSMDFSPEPRGPRSRARWCPQ